MSKEINNILKITPEEPEYMILEDEESLNEYLEMLKKDLLVAQKGSYNISVSKNRSKIIFDVWLY